MIRKIWIKQGLKIFLFGFLKNGQVLGRNKTNLIFQKNNKSKYKGKG